MEASKPAVTDSSATVSDGSNTETDSEIHNLTTINSDSVSHPDSTTPFSVGQRVLAFHKNLFYEARVYLISI